MPKIQIHHEPEVHLSDAWHCPCWLDTPSEFPHSHVDIEIRARWNNVRIETWVYPSADERPFVDETIVGVK